MPSTSYSAVKVLGIPRLVLARGRIVAVVGERGGGERGGEVRPPAAPADAVEAGIGLVPEDRKVESLLPAHSVWWSARLTTPLRVGTRGVLRPPGGQGARGPPRPALLARGFGYVG
ncbi:hypothetical protein AB0399_18025 [Streptomyces sp. NPDC088194]|uniref:hypothetical protein n=1 Tax=Streptomyces sp. NPDC088194 TaxID=3154931 RepID=UPI00344D8EDB